MITVEDYTNLERCVDSLEDALAASRKENKRLRLAVTVAAGLPAKYQASHVDFSELLEVISGLNLGEVK